MNFLQAYLSTLTGGDGMSEREKTSSRFLANIGLYTARHGDCSLYDATNKKEHAITP